MNMDKIYSKLDELPQGRASDRITRGCLVLEGGGWKGLYTLGVLDCLMVNDINLSSVVGVSAGALSGVGYVSGQIGWGARIDLTYRHDSNYCGWGAIRRDHGITGFTYLFNDLLARHPLDNDRLMDPARRFAVSATNVVTGKTEYFEKGRCDLFKAVQASATVPYVSAPVEIEGSIYLDGGCSENIPLGWAEASGEDKIVVVKTREHSFRRERGLPAIAGIMYGKYPEFLKSFENTAELFNSKVEELYRKSAEGKAFVIEPSSEVTVTRFEGDMDKLGDLYHLGYDDALAKLDDLKKYLDQGR